MIQTASYWLALAASVVIFWRLPDRLRLPFLAAASAAYLLTLDPVAIASLLGWCALFYYLPGWAKAHAFKRATTVLVLAILGYWVWFKLLPPLFALFRGSPAMQLALPLGISYFTVKLIHYAVERGRGRFGEHRFADFAAYLLLFPIYTAGPVERFDNFLSKRQAKWSNAFLVEGGTRIVHGFIKRFLIADAVLKVRALIAPDAHRLVNALPTLGPLEVWAFFALSFAFLYLEFSAYTDFAIGSARLFGLSILENFNFPWLATSLADFWRRWHMSLTNWCRSYVYMPVLGATRNPYVANYASFAAMGVWHGTSWHWLLWGLTHASGLAVYTRWSQLKQRRRWRFTESRAGDAGGWVLTQAFAIVAVAIPTLEGTRVRDLLRVCAKLAGLS